ncbi:MAG: ATP-binding protein [candidate division KSB1 bacterium]|nr:ATP-binding protein [candidate division KSB1 bacterium]
MVKIAEIVRQNPWWNQGIGFAQHDPHLAKAKPIFFRRNEIAFARGNIYVLRGPRQVGKTTYLKDTVRQLIKKGILPNRILYLSFDFFTSRRELRNALNYFLDATREAEEIYLLFDEISALNDWNLELKYLADLGITGKSVIIATGSSAVRLKEKAELLPGRGLEGNEYYFKPLTFREFVLQSLDHLAEVLTAEEFRQALANLGSTLPECALDLHSDLEKMKGEILKIVPFKSELQYLFRIYLICGGNPGVINHYFVHRYEKLAEKIDASIAEIFIRDVLGDLSRLQKQEIVAREILKVILESYGSRYSFTRLSKAIERTHATAIDYLEALEESFILSVLYAYDFSKKDIKSKGEKKVFFLDPFFHHAIKSYLSGREIWEVINQMLQDEEIQSHLVEGVAVMHLLMHKERPYIRKGNTFLWNYYDKSGKEIDAVLKVDSGYLGIEVKYQAQVSEREVKPIAPIKNYIIFSKDDIGFGENILVVPIEVFLALLPKSERNI